jgi:thiol-disulfide isomerase/thioredoxin
MKAAYSAILAAAAFLFSACQPAAAPVAISKRPVSINDVRQPNAAPKPVAEMTWTNLDGSEQRVADHRDKVLILDFWATYCPPCRDEIPHLNALQAKYGPDRLQIVGLNVGGDDDRPKIPAFVSELKVAYPIAFPEQALLTYVSGEDDRIPQTAVFDKQGQLVLKIVGFDPAIKEQLDRAVESAVSQ